MPIHPLRGHRLELIRLRREHDSPRQMVIARVVGASNIEVPIHWTDRGAPWVTPIVRGKEVKLSARGLLALARAVAAALEQELDLASWPSPTSSQADTAERGSASSRGCEGDLGGARARDTKRARRGVGELTAQGTQRRRGRR